MFEEYQELVSLSRLALGARKEDIQLFIRRLSRRLRKNKPTIADQLDSLLADGELARSPLRKATSTATAAATTSPVDLDSRLELIRPEYPVSLPVLPIWPESVERRLKQLVVERGHEISLASQGLHPTRSALLTGAPGVGKSLAARWIANKLDLPLLTLDLATVMSSYLGRTGANIKQVLDYAKKTRCVLLLDEFDSVAKRRDDRDEIGELKRLVTVLLQEIDGWPPSGLLVAATNHPDLLDPAVWRRFEMVVEFPMPNDEQTNAAVAQFAGEPALDAKLIKIVAASLNGQSFSDIQREMLRARREAVTAGMSLEEVLQKVVHDSVSALPVNKRKQIAIRLTKDGLSQHEVNKWTGVHRSTIRSATKKREA